MYSTITARTCADVDELALVDYYNEFVRRVNSKFSIGYINKAWTQVCKMYEACSAACADWIKYYIICLKNRTIRLFTPKSAQATDIIWNCEPITKDCQQLYLIELRNAKDKLIWSKVGTTTRDTNKRMKEHLNYYAKYGITRIVVNRVWECDTDAEAYESAFRFAYIKKYPGAFQKNDRFYNVAFDLYEAEELFEKFKNWG